MKVWTSRYSNPLLVSDELAKVAITVSLPRFRLKYPLAGRIRELAPWGLHRMTDQVMFEKLYRERLDEVGVELIRERFAELEEITGGLPLALVCYENVALKPCHRTTFREWWLETTGERIDELEPADLQLVGLGQSPARLVMEGTPFR